jgi:hypothetical protein
VKPVTVAECAERYMAWFREHRKSVTETEQVINTHILPPLGNKVVSELKAPMIRAWLDKLAASPARVRTSNFSKAQNFKAAPKTHDQRRARRATANRVRRRLGPC